MKRLMSICKHPNCNNLISSPGYCVKHKYKEKENKREAWNNIKKRQPLEEKAFYQTNLWHRTSKRHRKIEPLCRRCKEEGRTTIGVLVHHNPPLRELLLQGSNPYLDDYLETLCFNCHQKELKKKNCKSLTYNNIEGLLKTSGVFL